ncbi:MAG: VWA domain-containing protein [Chloroflexi bacterium]|nr:VWA domain-containing protein [Chloroflexota bacterium]
MSFLWPGMLWFLLVLPVLVALYVWSQRRRSAYAIRYASLSLVKDALGKGPGIKRHIPPALFLLAVAAMIVGLARPESTIIVPRQEGTVILVIDVSGSMQAEDMQPTRMEAAKEAATRFVERQPQGVRIGVVSFTDNAAIVQSPTVDKEPVLSAINRLQPQRGTAVGRGLASALDAIFQTNMAQAIEAPQGGRGGPGAPVTPAPALPKLPPGEYAPAIVVLLTDGESNVGPDPVEVARLAADRRVRVYTVGVGSPDGVLLRIQGRAVRTRLDESTLKQMSDLTDGDYYRASTETDLKNIYDRLGTSTVVRTEKTEITFLFTASAIVVSLLAGMLSLLWFNRLP